MITRRQAGIAAGASLLLQVRHAQAGSQIEEPIAESVLNALRSTIRGTAVEFHRVPEIEFATTDARLAYLRWLVAMSGKRHLARMQWPHRRDFLQTVWYEAKRARLDLSVVLGLIQVESNFNKFAVSSAGARGFMQVMPFWTRLIDNSDPGVLFHTRTNMRFGCSILRYYLLDRERGDLFMALGRYNGSRGKPQYPNAVFAASRNWEFRDAPPPGPGGSLDPAKPAEYAPRGSAN